MVSDPIADMLTRIRNGYMAKKNKVNVPFSNIKQKLAEILVKEGFLAGCQTAQEGKEKSLILRLAYKEDNPAVTQLKRVSKPGQRVYQTADRLPRVLSGLGIAIVSTSGGLMTAREARKKNLGGEVVCEVW